MTDVRRSDADALLEPIVTERGELRSDMTVEHLAMVVRSAVHYMTGNRDQLPGIERELSYARHAVRIEREKRRRAEQFHVDTAAVLSAVREALGFVEYADDDRVIEEARRLHHEHRAVCDRLGICDDDEVTVVQQLGTVLVKGARGGAS